ncbi:MAG: hypothetical protein ACREPI_01580, partial [Candidatus Dormibacterales bacterium]
VTQRRRDAARVLLDAPDAVARSQAQGTLSGLLAGAGLPQPEAAEAATMMLSAVLVSALRPGDDLPAGSEPLLVAVDTGSRGVTLRTGPVMSVPIRAAGEPGARPPAVVRGDRVTVRRLRGGRQGELELNPACAWRFQVQAPTWNTTLDLLGLDVRGIHIDSGAVRVECVLPPPRGTVPIHISSGVAGVRLRRPPGVPVVAEVSTGAVRLRLDGRTVVATTSDLHWESAAGAAARDHYAVKISSGAVRVTLEEDPSLAAVPAPGAAAGTPTRAGVAAALDLVLDGVAARGRRA